METNKMTLEQLSTEIEKREQLLYGELGDKAWNNDPEAIRKYNQVTAELEELRAENKKRNKVLFAGTVAQLKERGYYPEEKK